MSKANFPTECPFRVSRIDLTTEPQAAGYSVNDANQEIRRRWKAEPGLAEAAAPFDANAPENLDGVADDCVISMAVTVGEIRRLRAALAKMGQT